MDNAWQDFGQQVSLTSRIRELLLNYPEGTSIFKELIQNADDARATTISLCLDYRHHGKTSLAFQELAPFQGPALLVHNNAIFSEADFDSIRHIGDSVKRGQVAKTGRYGLGFTSCYHLTEIPTFVSGKYLCMFDPAAKFLPGSSAGNPGKRIDFVSARFSSMFPDSASTLKAFGCDMEHPFNGTLFRFALRTEEMSAASGISKQVYAPERLHELLKDLQMEAHLILLFLKSVESIQVCEWLSGQKEPKTVFKCGLKNATPDLRVERSMFIRVSQAVASLSPNKSSNDSSNDQPPPSASSLTTALQSITHPLVHSNYVLEIESSLIGTTRYLIGQACSTVGTPAWELAMIVGQQMGISLVPWSAIALPLPCEEVESKREEGRVFCFLPLPASSGMPAHINGTFELSSNRRDIWHGASDLLGVGKQRAAWNALLLADIAAPLYTQVLAIAATQLGPTEAYFNLFPGSIEALRARDTVAAFVDPWLKSICTAAVAYTNANKGRWLAPQDAIFLDDRAAKDTDLAAALLYLNLPITSSSMPQSVTRMMVKDALTEPKILLPALLRQHMKSDSRCSDSNNQISGMSPMFAAALLDFAASDILEDDRDSVEELLGVKLIPILNGSVGSLVNSGSCGNEILFVPRGAYELELFSKARKKLVDVSVLRPETLQKLIVIGRLRFFNLRLIDAALASEQLLHRILPSHFKGQRRVEWLVSNNVEELIPSKEWIQKLWQWLETQQNQARGKGNGGAAAAAVIPLADWPIIPTTSGFLLAPEPLQTSILITQPCSSSDISLLSALNKLGCEIFDNSIAGSSSSDHQLFAHPADGPGVLRALLNSYKRYKASGSIDQWLESVLPVEREELRTFLLQPRWFGASKQKGSGLLEEVLLRFLAEMPIYPRAASLCTEQQEKKEEQNVPASSPSSPLFYQSVLRHPSLLKSCEREADGVLLDRLGVKQLTKAAFYKQYVLPVLSQVPLPVAQSVSIQLLRELPVLHQADPTLIPLLRNTPLVTTVDGTAVTAASRLYDPRNGDLMLLLDPGKNFPAGEYGPVLDQLKMLGMRTSAGRDTVLQAAKDISAQQHSSLELEAAASRGRALLAYIDMEASRLNKPSPANSSSTSSSANGDDEVGFTLDSVFSKVASFLGSDGASTTSTAAKETPSAAGGTGTNSNNKKNESEVEEFWEKLKSLAWCPVQCTPPVPGLPWCTNTSSTTSSSSSLGGTRVSAPDSAAVAAPKEMRPRAETWLVCSQRLIIDGEPRSQVLLSKMGWNTPLDCEVLARHLAALGRAFTPPIGGGEDAKTEENNNSTPDSDSMSTSTPTISSSLRQQLAEIVPQLYRTLATLPPRDLTKVRTILGNTTPCIWIGDGFAPVGKVAMKGPLNLSSAGVYVIPLELAPFRDLLLALGISASFSAKQYIGVLAAMHAELSSPNLKSLSSTQLEQALAIAAALADMHIPAAVTLYLPDEHAVLRATSDLMYNDAPWTSHSAVNTNGTGGSFSPEETFYFIHPVISNDVAERLGVTSLQRCLLVHNADAFPMALTGAAVEAFGQSEALTTRLRHILEAYPDGSGVLMELLQNADDAGASTARFLLDRSEWGTDRVMGSKMSSWQGPALMAWNDAVFSPSDVQNIARIGQDTKLSRPDATGRFGLGFNSVFHFSDLPSFVSGDFLVMFDPHASWLPGVTLAQPGIKIRFPSSPLVNHFPDSFQPYQVFGCDMHQRYNGTLFRFPLRTEELAPLSEIKPQAYRAEDVLNLFENFKNQAPHALLFLKSLKLVELWVRDNSESEPRQMFSAELAPVFPSSQHPQAEVKAFVSGQGGGKEGFYQRLKTTKDCDLPTICTTVDVRLQNTSQQQEQQINQQRWLVCNLLAGGGAKQLALQGAAAATNVAIPRGWVPWAGVAAPIYVGEKGKKQEIEPFQGRAFCFLPLPALTQLPVHINGLFELSSNRRDLWHGQDLSSGAGKIRADWNSALLVNGAAVGYVRLLVAATKIEILDLASFYSLWPQQVNLPEPWNEVIEAFYCLLIDQPVVWSAAQGGIRLALMLSNEGLPVLDTCIPDVLVSNLLKYHPQLVQNNILTPAFLRRYLGEKGRLPVSVEKEAGAHAACLQYCLLDYPWNNGDNLEDLQDLMGVPLLPLADGSLGFLLEATAGVRPHLLPVSAPASGSNAVKKEDIVDLFKTKLSGRLISLDSTTTSAAEQQEQQPQLREQLMQLAASRRVNLRVLDAIGIADEVLPVYLPASWQNQLCVDASSSSIELDSVSAEWMLKLWKVIADAENNTASSGRDVNGISTRRNIRLEALSQWPLIPAEKRNIPVFAAPSPSAGLLEEGAFTEATMSALSNLGCAFIVLQVSRQLPEMVTKSQCIHPPTGLGVLTALLHVFKATKKSITGSTGASVENSEEIALLLSNEEKDALRAFLLQPRWFEGETLQAELAAQLLSLPIYRCCTRNIMSCSSSAAAATSPSVMFSDLMDGEKYLLPDEYTDYAALSSNFIYSTSPGEAQVLVKVLGIKPISLGELMINHAVPAASEIYDDAVLAALITPLLRQVATGTASPALVDCLRNTPCIATQQKRGVRLRPAECFDPRHTALRAMLGDAAAFPATGIFDDEQVLDGLVALGMRVSIDKNALLQVAKQIHSECIDLHDRSNEDGKGQNASSSSSSSFSSSSSSLKLLAERGAALLAALDDVAQKQQEASEDDDSYWSSLLDLSFLPVLTKPSIKGLPCPFATTTAASNTSSLVVPSLGPPRKVRPQDTAWLCSATLSLLDGQCSNALQIKLGWTTPLPAKVLAAQLVALGQLRSRPTASPTSDQKEEDEALPTVVGQAATEIYSQLEQHFSFTENLGQQQQNVEDSNNHSTYTNIITASLLSSGPSIWVGDGFVSPSLVALHTPTDLTPYIFSVDDILSSHENLVKTLNIPATPTAEQYLKALGTMATENENQPLDPDYTLLVALALIDGLGGVLLAPQSFPSPRQLLEKYPGYLPDSFGVLAPASALMYNDAPWLPHKEDQRMVHQDVAAEIATALGAQSLRYHHQVENQTSERLPCPSANLLRQLLAVQADPAILALSDILEIADAVNCHDVQIHLDTRTHPSQSLLQPGLGAFQGPALCIKLGGVVLSADELCRLQSPPSNYRLRQSTCTFGCGLLVSYMLTDVIQVVSGDSFYIFDPSATHLAIDTGGIEEKNDAGGNGLRPGSASSSIGSSTGHAKQYRYAGTDLPRRFADQFSVWDWAGQKDFTISSPIDATLIRLPLRTAPMAATAAALYKASWTVEAGLEVITRFASTISQTLLFAEKIHSISISHQGIGGIIGGGGGDDVVLIKEARIKLPLVSTAISSSTSARLHRSWCEEKEWRRAVKSTSSTGFLGNLSSNFSKLSWLGGGGVRGNNSKDGRSASPKKGKEDDITDNGASRITQHAILVRSHNMSSMSSGAAGGDPAPRDNKILKEQNEHWMVSVCAGGYSSADIAADKRYTHHNLNPQAAVAIRIDAVHPGKPAVAASPGLLSTWPLQDKTSFSCTANSTNSTIYCENSLFGLPFTVSAFFTLTRSGGRRLVAPAASSKTVGAAEASPNSTDLASSDLLGSPRETTEHVKARFNAALLKCTGHAAALLLKKLVLQNQHADCRALYSLLPLQIESPATTKTDVAVVCFQLCTDAAKKRMWKLGRGDIVTLKEGCVMQQAAAGLGSGLGDLSEAARNFMQARLPLFDVPDGVKPWLEAWGVEGIRGVSPITVRQELKLQAVSGVLASSGAFSAAVAAELLFFAASDVLPCENTSQEEGEESTVESAVATPPVVNLDALRDCKGLPCLDITGNIQLFGSKTLVLVPEGSGNPSLDPTTRLFASEPTVLSDFLHPELAKYLSTLLAHPSIASTLQVETYSLVHLSKHLSQVLPSHWAPVGMGGDAPLCVPWHDGKNGGPSGADFFLNLWSFLHSWRAFAQNSDNIGASGGGNIATWIDPLAGWAIIPSCSGDMVRVSFRHLVVTPSFPPEASLVNLMDEDVPRAPQFAEPWHSKLVPALLEAKMLVLDPRFAALANEICNAAYEDNANSGNEEAVLFAKLKAASDVGQLDWNGLSSGGREAFLSWLAEQAALPDIRTQIRSAELEMLQKAPIYPTLASSHGGAAAAVPAVALLGSEGNNTVDGAVSSDVLAAVLGTPEAAPNALQQRLLHYSPSWDALYRLLDVKILDSPALLAAVMQQPRGFQTLSPAAQESCLDIIERDWHLLQARDECVEALSNSEFVTTAEQGKLATPRALFDPTLPLLATIFAGRAVFPHGKFSTSQWISVLRSLGLKRSLDRPTVLDAARSVERRAKDEVQKRGIAGSVSSSQKSLVLAEPGQQLNQSVGQVWEAAAAVANHLATDGSDLLLGTEGRELAENLRELAFVPSKTFYLGRAAGAPTLAKYTDIVLSGDAPLAWTVAPVLDMAAAAPPLPIVHATLRIKSPPPFSSVVEHLKNIDKGGCEGGSSLNAWPFTEFTPQSAFERVLLYLESEGLSSSQLDQLRGGGEVALVPVANGTRVVKPSSIFVRLPVDAAPLLYELPPEFVSGLAILKKLGVSDSPSANDLLSAVRHLSLGSRLSTPYIHAVARILNYLLVETSAPEALAAASRGEIPVLNAYSTVTMPLNCVWGDAGAWNGLITRLAAAGGVSVAHPAFTPSLCKKLRIPSFTQVVQERLEEDFSLTSVSEIQGVLPSSISARLKEPCIAEAVHAALEAQHRWAAALAPGRDIPVASLEEVAATLHTAAAGVEFVKTCRTILATVKKSNDNADIVVLPGSSSTVASFASSDGGHRFIIAAEPQVDLSAAIAAGVTKLFKSQMMLPIAPLFAAKNEMLPATAGLLKHGDTSSVSNTGTVDLVGASGLIVVTTAGELGALLTPQDAKAVKLLPLRRFAARELVAVRMPTGQLRYARVAANCAPPPGAPAFKVTLELSQGKFQDVLSPEILSFSGDISIEEERREEQDFGRFVGGEGVSNILLVEKNGGGSLPSEETENQQSVATTRMAPTTAATAPEVVAAVRSMLESAGMTMENDTSVLMEQTLVLQQRLATTQHSLDTAVVEKHAAEAAATHLKTVWQCRICLTREVDSAMSGCGHMLCSSCAEQLPRPECPFCRKRSSITRLYR
ncbi:hypothetical protein Ndes2526B_g00282 [Nannochloris sp. 'desiccata']